MGFLPAGWPYNQTTLGGGQPNTSAMTPQQYLDYLTQLANTPQGQQAANAQNQTIAMQVKQALAAMQNERDRIAIAQGQQAANEWYQRQQVQLAQQAHQLAELTQQQNYGLAVGGLTGSFNGQPTLAALGQQAQYTGLYNGSPTLQAINQGQQFGLQQGALTGYYNNAPTQSMLNQQQQYGLAQSGLYGYDQNGNPTLAGLQNQQNYGLALAGLTGQAPGGGQTLAGQNQAFQQGVQGAGLSGFWNGSPTTAYQNQLFNQGLQLGAQTGYQNGNATLAREQAAANVGLQAAQLGASLQGPGNWAQYLQAANAVGSNPAVSNLLASAPGGLGAMQGDPGGPMTLGKLLADYGVMPGQGGGSPGASPLSAQEQARFDQIVARQNQQRAAGEAVDPNDAAELQRYMARGGQSSMPMGGARPPINQHGDPLGTIYAGGSPTFNESTGSYSSAPAGGMRPSPQPVQNWMPDTSGGMYSLRGSPGAGGAQQASTQGYNPYSLTGALGQAASQTYQPTAQQLGFQNDDEMNTVKGWIQNPNQAPSTWWSSKSQDQKAYLGGLMQQWGQSPTTFMERERNARPRQASPFAA